MYILAYDFGTGGIKASLYGADGACVASGFDAYETSYSASGFHEQSPEDWWRATVRSTRRATCSVRREPDSYVVNDDVEIGFGSKVPLWLFGFLY